ncbi:PREDICTED: vegetative cell wall protein gp1-like [Chinchilla lanigera]|uniref:vegetative cell wall protein gp1-like n=1 Tax=Chinchilla lanigera TaxID=34839 RepID=UPI00038F048F|nr:PREDICTED: vegetative cell wall protein gp1-like [Chinchilla lanigera]
MAAALIDSVLSLQWPCPPPSPLTALLWPEHPSPPPPILPKPAPHLLPLPAPPTHLLLPPLLPRPRCILPVDLLASVHCGGTMRTAPAPGMSPSSAPQCPTHAEEEP